MVNEDGGIAEASLDEYPFCLAIKTWLGGLHMIHGDALPRLGCRKDRMVNVVMAFGAPRNFCHGPEQAAGASRWPNIGKACRDLSVEGEILVA